LKNKSGAFAGGPHVAERIAIGVYEGDQRFSGLVLGVAAENVLGADGLTLGETE
jgi:hypothetical protein